MGAGLSKKVQKRRVIAEADPVRLYPASVSRQNSKEDTSAGSDVSAGAYSWAVCMGSGEKQTQATHSADIQSAGAEAGGFRRGPLRDAQCALGVQEGLRIIPARLSLDRQPAELDATEFCIGLSLCLQSLHPFWEPGLNLCSSLNQLLSRAVW